jgi:hypothetical protein
VVLHVPGDRGEELIDPGGKPPQEVNSFCEMAGVDFYF